MSSLLNLPLRLRTQILGYLLPDKEVLDPDWSSFDWKISFHHDKISSGFSFSTFLGSPKFIYPTLRCTYRHDGDRCHTAILRTNRELHHEGTSIMYCRTFVLTIYSWGVGFLGRLDSAFDFRKPFEFPWHLAKHVQIRIAPSCGLGSSSLDLRRFPQKFFLDLACRRIASKSLSLNMLSVGFASEEYWCEIPPCICWQGGCPDDECLETLEDLYHLLKSLFQLPGTTTCTIDLPFPFQLDENAAKFCVQISDEFVDIEDKQDWRSQSY